MGDSRDMQKTRAPGVYRLADGRFHIRWTVQIDGRRKDREATLESGATLEDAVAERARMVKLAKSPPPTPAIEEEPPPALGAYALSWLGRKTMKHRAKETYAQVLEDHVLPLLGDIRVDRLRRSDLEAWLVHVETWGYRRARARPPGPFEPVQMVLVSRETLKGWWTKLKHLVRDARAEYELSDITARMQGPKAHGRPRVHETRTATWSELRALMEALPESWRAEAIVDANSGMRPGELYELQWPDVDLERREFTVSRSHAVGIVGATKTGKVKVIPFGAVIEQVLKEHRRRQLEEQSPALATGLLFPSSIQGKTNWRRRPSALRNELVDAGVRAGLPMRMTPQVLRRTFNTLMKTTGIDPAAIRDLMGHSSEQMTDRYFAAPEGVKRAAVLTFERKLAGTE